MALEGSRGRVARGVVATQAVVEHRARVGSDGDEPAKAACGRLPQRRLDQLRGLRLLAAPGRKDHLGVRDRRVPGRLRDQAILLDRQRRRGELARDEMGSGDEVQREAQLHERARVAGDLCLASGQDMPGLGVPQLERDDDAGSGPGEPEPAAGLVGGDLPCEDQLECPGQRRRGRRVAVRQLDRQAVEQDVDGPRRVGAGRRRPGGLGGLAQGAVQVARPHRGHERLEVRLAR